MNPRSYLVQQLRSQLLGPREGLRERLTLEQDPRDEYVTGILEVDSGCETHAEPEINTFPAEFYEEEETDQPIESAFFTPACDPRREPSAMGISWVVRAENPGVFRACCTLAIYQREDGFWSRQPFAWVEEFSLSEPSCQRLLKPLNVFLHCHVRSRGQDIYQISLHLVHRGLGDLAGRTKSERLVFQPQLRICLDSSGELLGLGELEKPTGVELCEENRLRLLYRDLPVKARGHFCAATWKEVDPEQAGLPDSPWQWPDGELLPEQSRLEFARADLRSEFLPVLAVPTPELSWRDEFGQEPMRRAAQLAECFAVADLEQALRPLLSAYATWLDRLRPEASALPQRYQAAAAQHIELCQGSLRRMQEGLQLLLDDEQVRLAFCFSQQALYEQAAWKGDDLVWRPFQLGFFLQCVSGIALPHHADRQLCDLLWFPTGGGKTEAYLALIAFVAGLRRLRHEGYDGVAVISRYTLRLLSIQQFRRGLRVTLACEVLRRLATAHGTGWRPSGCASKKDFLWGQHPFSTGLWVGGGVTPNRLQDAGHRPKIPGALSLLTSASRGEGEPAQVLDCPACDALLAVAESDYEEITLHLRLKGPVPATLDPQQLSTAFIQAIQITIHPGQGEYTLSVLLRGNLLPTMIDDWWSFVRREVDGNPHLQCSRASRPGYFVQFSGTQAHNFEVHCPNPGCLLNHKPDQRIPLCALTTDDQIYGWPPTLLIATVDKFARLPFEPRAASLFGNVEYYHPREGYYRVGCTQDPKAAHPPFKNLATPASPLPPPDLILQDELHLVDGPLGSMMGLYETVVEKLCTRPHAPKYIASTATVREAQEQVQSLFGKDLCQFPAAGLRADDNFFAMLKPGDPFQESGAGRLYLGLCCPGRGAISPLVRAWATVLQGAQTLSESGLPSESFDGYWSPVGYFSALSQLATVSGLFRQYIPQRLHAMSTQPRELPEPLELSSRVESQRLPALLTQLEQVYPRAVSGVLATSMFGTGVDVSRLSLMIVHGQPKTTSSYIQATGRVGRSLPGLIITSLSPVRPRELNHYEYFTGYHVQLYRGVEPVTVYPFAPRARDKALGPLCLAHLRQQMGTHVDWRDKKKSATLILQEWDSPEVRWLTQLFSDRMQLQPEMRQAGVAEIHQEIEQALQAWREAAEQFGEQLELYQYTLQEPASRPVVLGDPQHTTAGFDVVFSNTPQSLREVETTTGFKV